MPSLRVVVTRMRRRLIRSYFVLAVKHSRFALDKAGANTVCDCSWSEGALCLREGPMLGRVNAPYLAVTARALHRGGACRLHHLTSVIVRVRKHRSRDTMGGAETVGGYAVFVPLDEGVSLRLCAVACDGVDEAGLFGLVELHTHGL